MLGNTGMVAKATRFLYSKMSLDLNNVPTKFQLDWPANSRIIAGSLFSQFPKFSKC